MVFHSSPNVESWPETVRIIGLRMRAGADNGLSFEFSPRTWPDYTPPGWDGPIQYTVWPLVKIDGVVHTAGIIQMWRTRPSTGAPIIAQWNTDWCYDPNRWGVMCNYRPKAGDEMGFMLTAGNGRGTDGVTSVRERSNIVWVNLPAGDNGTWTFPASEPVPAPTPPTPTPTPDLEIKQLLNEIKGMLHVLLTKEAPEYESGPVVIPLPPIFGGPRTVQNIVLKPRKKS